MTSNFNEKIDTLCLHEKYREAVDLINSLPDKEKTYPVLLKLASIYYDMSDEDNIEHFHDALKILQNISYEGEADISWLYLMGKVYFHLNQEETAIEYFEKVDRICQKDNEIHSDLFVKQFIKSCHEYINHKTILTIHKIFKNYIKDDILISDADNNKIFIKIPKYKIDLQITMSELNKNECEMIFDVKSPFCMSEKIQGYGHSLENAVYSAVSSFFTILNNKIFKR